MKIQCSEKLKISRVEGSCHKWGNEVIGQSRRKKRKSKDKVLLVNAGVTFVLIDVIASVDAVISL